jgi:hypothetical protein
MSAPTLGAHRGAMFTLDAAQQIIEERRRRLLADAANARMLHLATAAAPPPRRTVRHGVWHVRLPIGAPRQP